MPRSEASKEHRREYARQWRASQRGQDYHKQWRVDHAEEERERHRQWKLHNKDLLRAQRLRYLARRDSYKVGPLPGKFLGHDFFETARFICGHEPYFDWHRSWEEAMGEAVLALVEGRDPEQAVKDLWSRERGWQRQTGPIHPNVDIREHDRRVVFVSRRDV